ncbi:GNAT family N-acetyltransferase [Janthinobacterium agaricidamnosum]|uniref:Acetyltransferase family protein n=1 Tax=Janthinobacterium agaricidamnosum NBRC 102515 = DSM 9628 TaxID=1349767 RepID=W0V9X7_9BURK|nr:GNAT family N-acetyltransferase [Janthinobacterium agaricidamnosum]CDG84062.1 acetyltransferase family protein [Janthinobacterium agaricidamnosum NBRC 102515 = DSM 9628]
MTILHTARLRLEPITEAHYDRMRTLNSDPVVMTYLNRGQPEAEEKTRAAVERITRRWAEWGYSWWALIRLDDGEMVGMACLQHLDGEVSQPLEIGWRLARAGWGQGYASEAAAAIVSHAFTAVGVAEVYAVAHPDNAASIKVMQRLGMQYIGNEAHYDLDCVVYRLPRP